MNTDISLATELELSDVELEAVVGGSSFSIGSISILSSYRPRYYYGSNNTVSQSYAPTGDTNNSGNIHTYDSSTGFVSNGGGNSYNGGSYSFGY